MQRGSYIEGDTRAINLQDGLLGDGRVNRYATSQVARAGAYSHGATGLGRLGNPRFNYWIENSSDGAIRFRDGDKGRGFAGKLLHLRESKGKVYSRGDKYVDPKEHPPAFGPVVQASGRGETVSELRRIAIKDFLGQLKVGKYTLQVMVPSGRLTVNDKPTPQLASGLLTFRVVALTDAMRRAIDAAPQDPARVILEPQARGAKPGVNHDTVDLQLTNGSGVPIEYEGYADPSIRVMSLGMVYRRRYLAAERFVPLVWYWDDDETTRPGRKCQDHAKFFGNPEPDYPVHPSSDGRGYGSSSRDCEPG